MEIIKSPDNLKAKVNEIKANGQTIGFVPTMGFLHEGHLSLIRYSKEVSDFTVVSIFVNPAQFNDPKDFEKYPIDIAGDLSKCESEKVDLVFLPEAKDIYPDGIPNIQIKIPDLMNVLCGKSRPGHFEGILLVISRLFHFVNPDFALFGKKDYQQWKIISRFVQDLAFPIRIIGLETKRESGGLAMSSRNARLNPQDMEAAGLIYRTLKLGAKLIEEGETNPESLKEILTDMLASNSRIRLDYLEILDSETLKPLERLAESNLIAIAAFLGEVRLIDNIVVESIV
jgi:pantoate--beta-alanine ligase